MWYAGRAGRGGLDRVFYEIHVSNEKDDLRRYEPHFTRNHGLSTDMAKAKAIVLAV